MGALAFDVFCAIDPGKAGGFAILDAHSGKVRAFKMPAEIYEIVAHIKALGAGGKSVNVLIEDVPTFISDALPMVSAMAKLQRNCGILFGAAQACGYTVELCPPQQWQSSLHLGYKRLFGEGWKRHLRACACKEFPEIKPAPTLATADALLILKYLLTH